MFIRQLKAEGVTPTAAEQQLLSLGFFTGCTSILQEVQDLLLSPSDGTEKLARVEALVVECTEWAKATEEVLARVRQRLESDQKLNG
jgi:hypothetical protein